MKLKLIFRQKTIFRFISFLNIIQKSASGGVKGVIMTITKNKITVIYDYCNLNEEIKIADFLNNDNENFAFAYFYYDLIFVPTESKAKTIDELIIFNGMLSNFPIEEVTIRFAIESVKDIIVLANSKKSKTLCIQGIKNPEKNSFCKTLFDVHVSMDDKVEKTVLFPFRSRQTCVKLNEINYGNDLNEFNHLVSTVKNISHKANKKGLQFICLYLIKENDKVELIYRFGEKHFKCLQFGPEDVKCYSNAKAINKNYAINTTSLIKIFPGMTSEDYLLNEELFLSNEYFTMKLSAGFTNEKDGVNISNDVFSQAIISIRIKESTEEELNEISWNENNNNNEYNFKSKPF